MCRWEAAEFFGLQPVQIARSLSAMDFFFGKLVPFIGAVAATAFGFWLNQTWQRERERKERYQHALAVLTATAMELGFYAAKLDYLANFLAEKIERTVGPVEGIVIPSFDFYPAFLEKMKLELVAHDETADLVPTIGECHYELGHIQAKLESYRASATLASDADAVKAIYGLALNSGALRGLASGNAQRFRDAQTKLQARMAELRGTLEGFYDRSVFGPHLRDSA